MCVFAGAAADVRAKQGVHEQIDCEASSVEWAEDGSDRESKIGALCAVVVGVVVCCLSRKLAQ